MDHGYNGKILHVDLSKHQFKVETPSEDFYRKYIGGSALNCYYLLKLIPPGIDPLSPENVLAVSVSVTTGAPFAGQSRVDISAKSPLTGLIGDSQAGGYFPAEMKFSGFDAFIFTGKSETPVYLWVNDGDYELRDASYLWGKITGEVEDLIKQELEDDKVEISQIGPAGENGVRYAAILNMCNRANGRTGMGAVMGSKKLKAIVVRGQQGKKNYTVADPEKLKNLAREGMFRFRGSHLGAIGKLGTPISVMPQNMTGQLPTNNFKSGVFHKASEISGEKLYEEYLKGAGEKKQDALGRETCYICPIRCKRIVDINTDAMKIDERYGGPEYETIFSFGSNCGIGDLEVISKANELCNMFGIDTISCGGTIAWVMECFERELLSKEDTDGIDLRFGNSSALLQIIELIGRGEGFGKLLGLGSAKAAEILGKGTEDFLVVTNKQEFPGHEPRVKVGLGLIYAVNPFGADHISSGHDPTYEINKPKDQNDEGPDILSVPIHFQQLGLLSPTEPRSLSKEKVRFATITQNYNSLIDSLCICARVAGSFGGIFNPNDLVRIVNSVTGWDMDLHELLLVGERRVNMMRIFNARDGYDKNNDKLPKRMFEPMIGGVSDGYRIDELQFKHALEEYYRQRGWMLETGNPGSEKIEELGLSWANSQ